MPTLQELEKLISNPKESLDVEYKSWLDLTENHGKATLAKAAIALANHGGGFIVIGFHEDGDALVPDIKPEELPDITQDIVNGVVRRFATIEFHCDLQLVPLPSLDANFPVISIPGDCKEPVMSKRAHDGVIDQNKCYTRKSGPRSEEPLTQEEWQKLLRKCVTSSKGEMLDSIRAIVSGQVDNGPEDVLDAVKGSLLGFCTSAHARWQEVIEEEAKDSPARLQFGYYELGFKLVGEFDVPDLTALQDHLREARKIKLTGWTPFLEMSSEGKRPYAHDGEIEAWIGKHNPDREEQRKAAYCDFWRASPAGELFTIRGYSEDSGGKRPIGKYFDVALPIWRVAEGILFADRFAESVTGVDKIAIMVKYTGLKGRVLTSLDQRRVMWDENYCSTDEVTLEIIVERTQIRDNLSELLMQLLTPLYESFYFFKPSSEIYVEELNRLKNRRL